MVIACLWSIYLLVRKNDISGTSTMASIFLMALGINLKMSGLLMLPGYMLVLCFKNGLLSSLVSGFMILSLQALFGIQFLMKNPESYFNMAYNFGREFEHIEQMNWQFFSVAFTTS